MNRIKLIILLCFTVLSLSCENLFFPPIDRPLLVDNPRLTPEGVISLLFQSYETRSIETFAGILSKDNFKFYVASGFDKTQHRYSDPLLKERPYTFMQFVNSNNSYYYWEYDAEIYSHRKLFSGTARIDAQNGGGYDIHYVINTSGDTVFAEVKIDKFTFEVTTDDSPLPYSVVNQPQVFLMQRDEKKLWSICKWFDLESENQ